jgi:NADH-quinone oxidoreductase subunit L
MFLACGVGQFWMGMFHVTTHAFFKALLFLGSGAVIYSMLGEQDMRKMGGLKKYIPETTRLMLVGTLAIAGVPPLSGFFSKDAILHAAQGSPWGSGVWLYGIGLLVALMTAFYMNRMMWKTFYVHPQFVDGRLVPHHHSNFDDEEHGHGHDDHGHEPAARGHGQGHHGAGTGKVIQAPRSMILPLYVLAVFSFAFGALVGVGGLFAKFLAPSIAPLSLGGLQEGHHLFSEGVGYVVSTVIALAGLLAAGWAYSQRMEDGILVPEARKAQWQKNPWTPFAFLYNTFAAKWGFDAVYDKVFIQWGGWLADRWLWRFIDRDLIDGAVNGLAKLVGGISAVSRRVQTGYVRSYALAMLIGVVSLMAGLLYAWNSLNAVVR